MTSLMVQLNGAFTAAYLLQVGSSRWDEQDLVTLCLVQQKLMDRRFEATVHLA